MFKRFMPQTLMGRSLLILVVPVILTQLFAVTVFWDNHWDKMTKRLADAVAGEIAIVSDRIENNYSEELLVQLSEYMRTHLDIAVKFEVHEQTPVNVYKQRDSDYGFFGNLMLNPLLNSLDHKMSAPYDVSLNNAAEEILVHVGLDNGSLWLTIPERRLFSSSGYVFIILLVGSSFILLFISILFLRNQIRPIRRLAAAASLMGKGRQVSIGKPRGALEVRQASEAFETMQRRIRRQIEQRTAMLAGVSHDLRTPLTRIKLGLSMLDDAKEAEDMLRDLDEMEKMVDAYLEFARGEKLEETQSVNMKQFVADILKPYDTDHLSVEFISEGTDTDVTIQKVNLRRCIENILSNSARYASKILVSLRVESERVYLTIEDNGEGIPVDQYEEVFKPFVRLDPSRNKETGGAGLGLSVAMDIILSHGGKISLDKSQKLGGLLVYIRLPV